MALTKTSFTPQWNSGKTTVIRVPEALADEILILARQMDTENLPCNSDSEKVSDQQIILEAIDRFLEQRRQEWGSNNAQKRSAFNPHSTRYSMLQEFKRRVIEGRVASGDRSSS
ncbi:MAG: hypothetical protein ACFE0J_22295 [Elainellaceae cyanobacterium]